MFRGQKCTQRCKNSLQILRRQEKATKLRLCQCQENEFIDGVLCSTIKSNMDNLCFPSSIDTEVIRDATVNNSTIVNLDDEEDVENEIPDDQPGKTSGSGFLAGNLKHPFYNNAAVLVPFLTLLYL